MSVSSTIANIKQKMTDFKVEFEKALSKTGGNAEHADVSDKLEGQTPAQVIAILRGEVTKHTSKLAQNIHQASLASIGTYTGPEFDSRLDQLLDNNSGVPFSFYGDREYLPPGITGSFESGSSASPYGNVAVMLEDNGTLVMLRSGTDGDSAGLYYSYMRDAGNQLDFTSHIVTTNTKYQPAFFPSDRQGFCILNATQQIIIGRLVNKSDGKFNGYFMSLTNNTFDQTKHTGIIIPENGIFNTFIEGTATANVPTAYIKNGYVYILINTLTVAAPALAFRVYRVPLANFISGVYVAPERVVGWSINRGSAGVVARDDIQLFDNVRDMLNRSGNAFEVVQGLSNGTGALTVHVNDAGNVYVTFLPWLTLDPTDKASQQIGFYAAFNFEITDSKVIDVAIYHNSKVAVRYDSVDFYWSRGQALHLDTDGQNLGNSGYYKNWYGSIGGQANIALYSTKFNQMWTFDTTTYYTQRFLTRYKYPANTNYRSVMNGDVRPAEVLRNGFAGRFGSALSQSFSCAGNIGDNVVTVKNDNTRLGEFSGFAVRAALEGNGTYQYDSISGAFGFKGFNPTVDRKFFMDLGQNNDLIYAGLNEGDPASGGWSSLARFASALPTTRSQKIDANITPTGTVTFPAALINTLRTQIVNDLASKGYALYASLSNLEIEVSVPQLYSDMPAFATVSFIRNDRSAWLALYALNISGSRQNVTAASIVSGSFGAVAIPTAGNNGLAIIGTIQVGQSAIRRVAGGFALGLSPSLVYSIFGDAEAVIAAATYVASTGKFNFVGSPLWNYYVAAPAGWLNFPNRGMYLVLCSEFLRYQIDAGTKLIGTLACTTQPITGDPNTDLYAALADPAKSIVIVSQKIVSAWTIYFSDVTPAMMNGLYVQVDTLTYNLTPGTDANKTFYIWLVRRGDVISYQVVASSTVAPTADSSLYIGYVTTTTEGIQQIVAEKRVAIGDAVLARNSQGSGIPLTSGTPNTSGKLNWK